MNLAACVQRASEILLHIHSVQDDRRICQHGTRFGGTGSGAVALGRRRTALDTDTGQKEPHRIYNSITATSPSARGREDAVGHRTAVS